MGRIYGIYVSEHFLPTTWYEIEDAVKNGSLTVFRVSSLVLCFLQTYDRFKNKWDFTDETKSRLITGTKIHYGQEKYNRQGYLTENEQRYWIRHKTLPYVITGRMDTLFTDFNGLFINDYKSCEWGAFYFAMKSGCYPDNILQLSLYGFLVYIIVGVELKYGVVTYIARKNIKGMETAQNKGVPLPFHKRAFFERSRLSCECELHSLDWIEEPYLEKHPLILLQLGLASEDDLIHETDKYAETHNYMCVECPVERCKHSGRRKS